MATKQEWQEYFALINDRQPSADEILAAIEKGEITLGNQEQTIPKAEITEDANRVYTNAKQHAGNYWTWVKPIIVNPSRSSDASDNTLFLWVSFVIASLTGAFSFSNVIRRGLNVALNSYSSFGTDLTKIRSQLSALNWQLFFYVVIIFAIFYLAALPGLLLLNRRYLTVKQTVSKYLKWFVPLSLINIIGAILSFFVPIASISISTLEDVSSIVNTFFASFAVITFILTLGAALLIAAQQFLISEVHLHQGKFDAAWVTLLQWIISIVVIAIEVRIIVIPLLQNLTQSIGTW
ncbi:hypothetical protein [Leuconostoc carnosum]|uniref:Uncharacterized protein n=1 Tax=Leuconostoc carnosum (strain JB16) TaxID=1229758 RepID=K0DE01_LEUCJ|nr:hypothetical protein [Leuconostoc carnosum]AFT82216.1 hypothetical protein C270_06535 [Leuconostoc carnosum JB16]KAA8327742.1 hypothetical protein FE409_06865 [Leuconostoc carnosum]